MADFKEILFLELNFMAMKVIGMKKIGLLISIACLSICKAQKINFQTEREFLKKNGMEPSEYVVSKFNNRKIVILGEDHAIKNNLEFVQNLIPKLYENGVTNLGMEFGAYEKQEVVDSLLTAKDYNQQMVRDIMYYYNVGWAYMEYMNLYKAAWEFNRTLPKDSKKFRIVNISYRYDWSAYDGGTRFEELHEVFHKGEPNTFRTNVIKQEVLDRNEKVLILVGVPHAYRTYREHRIVDGECTFSFESLGNRLDSKYPNEVFSILVHAPFQNIPGKQPYNTSPGNGKVEQIMQLIGNLPIGFDLDNTPMGRLEDNSNLGVCYEDFQLKDLLDGYVFLAPFKEMENCSLDRDFFKNRTWEETKVQIPDPYWHSPVNNFEEYWNQIKGYQNVRQRYKALVDETEPTPEYGKIVRLKNFKSDFVAPRNVDVWLPPNYDEKQKYSVLYMHDGQMLFDSTLTWNNQEWSVDETLSKMMHNNQIKQTIVVGIWNNGAYRHAEYFPQKPIAMIEEEIRRSFVNTDLKGTPKSDDYLKFITGELKPYIDNTFSTHTDLKNTFIAGSSMGGLISMYAFVEYPEIFGGATCLSTHWVGDINTKGDAIPEAITEYIKNSFNPNEDRKIYFDYGTKGLDSLYKKYQTPIDSIIKNKGVTSKYWVTKEFKGDDHSEKSWSRRFHIPMQFILNKKP